MKKSIFLIVFFLYSCSSEIVSNLDEREANKLLVVLAENKIYAKKQAQETEQGVLFTIVVQKKDLLRALQVLEKEDLPEEREKGVIDIFGKKDLLPTQTAERMLEEYSINAELARTIEKIKGVVNARVHIARIRDEYTGLEKPVSASVLVNYISENRQPFSVDEIKKLIAGGVGNLSEDNVKVVALPVSKSDETMIHNNRGTVFALAGVLAGLFVIFSGGFNMFLWNEFRKLKTLKKREKDNDTDKGRDATDNKYVS